MRIVELLESLTMTRKVGWCADISSVRRLLLAGLVLAATTIPTAPCQAHGALTVVENGTPHLVVANAEIAVPLSIRNDGSTPWDPTEPINIAAHWYDSGGELLIWDGIRTPLPRLVAPGDTVSLEARLRTPAKPGTYRLVWDLVYEGKYWLSQHDPSPPRPTIVRVGPSHAFTVVNSTVPKKLTAGRETTIAVRIRNDGIVPWPPDGEVNVAYHWLSPGGPVVVRDGERTPLPHQVWPGDTVSLRARVLAPRAAGSYLLSWDLVHEGVCWFSQRDPTPVEPIPVVIHEVRNKGVSTLTGCLVLLALGIGVLTRSRWSSRLQPWFAVIDLLWLGAVMAVVPWSLVIQAGQPLRVGPVAVATGFVALLLLLLLLLPWRWRPWLALTLGAGTVLLTWADTLYFRFFGELLSPAAVHATGQLEAVDASIRAIARPGDLWFGAVLVPGAVLCWLAFRASRRPPSRKPLALTLCAAVLAGALGFVGVDITVVGQTFETTLLASEVGPLAAHLLDSARAAGAGLWPEPDEARIAEIADWFRSTRPSRSISAQGPTVEGANLIMVQVESLQSFVIGLEIAGQEITPHLNTWLDDAQFFSTLRDQTAEGRSSDAELASQCSLLPMPHGSAAFLHPDNDYTGLAEILADNGWTTMSAVPFRRGFWNRGLTHVSFGYHTNLFDRDFSGGEMVGWGLSDRGFFTQMAPRIDQLDEPFCVWLLTLSLHHPFDLFPEHLKVLDLSTVPVEEIANYLHTMHLFDRAWGELMAWLEASAFAQRTVVALWGDHDAGFGFEPEVSATTGIPMRSPNWYESDRVPFALAIPGVSGARHSIPAGHTDIAPTILAVLGIDPGRYAFVGRNLLARDLDPSWPVLGMNDSWMSEAQLWIPTESQGRRCWDLKSDRPLQDEACTDGTSRAQKLRRLSTDILRYDLQERLHHVLEESSAGSAVDRN